MTTYDSVAWHTTTGEYVGNGATLIGFFLSWCNERDLINSRTGSDFSEHLRRGDSRTEFVMRHCEGMLTSAFLNSEGDEFAAYYYRSYFYQDLVAALGAECVARAFPDNDDNFIRICEALDSRYESWQEQVIADNELTFANIGLAEAVAALEEASVGMW